MNSTSNHFPRSLPFQAPQAAPAAAKWSRRHVLLSVAGSVLLVGIVAALVYANNRPPAAVAPSGGKPAETGGKSGNERMLEALGSLSAAHLYQTYLNIGLVADAVEHNVYDQAQGAQMLSTVAGFMDGIDKQLDRLAKDELSPEDREDVQHIRALSSLLRVQVASLQAYWATGEQKYVDRYQDTRKKAWSGLSKALRLNG